MKHVALTLAAALAVVLIPFTAKADVVDNTPFNPRDLCSNVKGVQTWRVIYNGWWEPETRTEDPTDCRPGYRTRPR